MDDAQTDAPSVEIAEIPDTLRAVAINVRKHMADERMREVLAIELEDCAAALASPRATSEKPLLDAINKACAIIELGDNRLLASDGPAGGQPPDLTLKEWRELYVTLDNARKPK